MKRTKVGDRFILSAGEVGAYTVCAESWRLRVVEGKSSEKTEAAKQGHRLHQQWAANYDEAVLLMRLVRLFLGLITLAALLHMYL